MQGSSEVPFQEVIFYDIDFFISKIPHLTCPFSGIGSNVYKWHQDPPLTQVPN